MKNKNLLLFIIITSLFAVGSVSAMETKFPIIGGITIDNTTGLVGSVKYFFILSIVAGAFIAVTVIIASGIIIMLSKGNPSKISDAKKKMFGALLGLLILGGTYSIIFLINSDITKIEEVKEREPIEDTGPNGVYLIGSDGKEIRLTLSTPNLFSKDFAGRANNVKFNQPDKGSKYAAIFFSDVDYKGMCYYGGTNATSDGSVPFAINSVYIFRTSSSTASPINIYNNDNGECTDFSESKTKKAFLPETTEVSSYYDPYKLIDNSGHWFESTSISISDDVLVLMETRNKESCLKVKPGETPQCPHCQIITKTAKNENCYSLKYNYTYNPDSIDTLKPGYITLFQKDN